MANDNWDNIENIKEAARLILKNEIKHLQIVPSVAIKLLKLTRDDNVIIEDLSRIIETEPSLAAKILNTVNSAAYELPNKITSIKHAVNILGFSAVRQLALNLLFYNKLMNHNQQIFDFLFFWQHCLYVASLSKRIAVALEHPDPDLVYTGGLLHDIGKLVLETYGRITYSDFISSIGNNKHSTIEEERNFFGITHTEMGYVFCLEWQLPASITAIVAHHHKQPPEASPYAEFKTETAIVSFANYIAWMQGIGSATHDSHPTLQRTVLEIIDTNRLDLEDLLQHVDQDMQNTREFYNIQFPSLTKLRATLIKTTINLSQISADNPAADNKPNHIFSSSLTVPHRSLNPDEFLPWTLDAMQRDFALDRVIMLNIDPKRRCLTVSHWRPQSLLPVELQSFEIDISTLSGLLLKCFREKKAAIINDKIEGNNKILQQLNVTEFIVIPVLRHNRLIGVLYADNSISKKPLHEQLPSETAPIAHELGIALFNAKQYDLEKKRAQLDPLTQLFNKRMINRFLTDVFQGEESKLANVAAGFVDIDMFKLFNDTCGHQEGDNVLRIVADILRSLTRPGDLIGRYGGEEFIFVLQDTDEAGAYGYAERIRSEIERRGKIMSRRFHNHELTVSVGVAMYSRQYASYTQMIEIADQAMYRAKNEGRNRIVMLTSTTPDEK
ncbi:MAG: HDOD domain-containing protein [Methylobacter sp.]|jgi:diguanylate cyclase (GGDEF)-like protein/putative nucleotidyltransferase with HDIG domain